MNAEKATEVVNEVLSKALEAATATGNFVVEQAPDVVQQLLTYKAFEFGTKTTALVLLSIACLVAGKKLWSYGSSTRNSWGEMGFEVVPGASLLTLSPLVLLGAMLNALNLAKVILAPKIFLIEYAAQLVK